MINAPASTLALNFGRSIYHLWGGWQSGLFSLFKDTSENVIFEEMNRGEFDWLVRFTGNADDPYYYCFKDEGCHIIYHRFLPEDYADFEF